MRAVDTHAVRKTATIRAMSAVARIAIAAGGTAGHVVPALAVADALRAQGAEVLFIGGDRAERALVPAAGYPFERLARRRARPPQPAARGARAVARGARAACARGRCCARARDRCRAGRRRLRRRPGRARRADAAHPDRADRGRQPPRPHQPRCSRRSRARVCLAFPIDGPHRPPLPRHRSAGRAADRRPRQRPRRASGSSRGGSCVLVFGGSLGSRTINEAALAGLDGAAFRVLHVTGARDWPALRSGGRAARSTTCASTSTATRSRVRWPPATSSSRAPAARSSRSPPTGARRSSSPTRRRPPTTSAPTPSGWSAPARRSSSPTTSCSGPRLAHEVGRLIGDRGAAGGDGAGVGVAGAPGRRRGGRARSCWRSA